jgi:signal transduction histidine kinase
MNKYLDAMSVRIFVIVVLGAIATAIIVLLLSKQSHDASENLMRLRFTQERIEQVIKVLDLTPVDKRNQIVNLWQRMGVNVNINVANTNQSKPLNSELSALQQALTAFRPVNVMLQNDTICNQQIDARQRKHLHQCLAIYTHLQDSTQIRLDIATFERPRPPPSALGYRLILTLLGLLYIAWLVSKIATKPLRKLANAAQALAQNIESPPLPQNEGSIEVREASAAFNNMQTSIRQHLQERSFMLGAIAHDLQTPLTRLRLRLEKVQDVTLKQSLINDLAATQSMVSEGLDFARLSAEDINKDKLNLNALMCTICNDALDAGHAVELVNNTNLIIIASPNLLRRCLTNLLDNAIQYGKQAKIEVIKQNEFAIIFISDNGPGIPKHSLNSVLQPFKRLEDSRSRDTGGTGLGLTIARMIIEKHNGTLSLENKPAPETGLIATVKLPIL